MIFFNIRNLFYQLLICRLSCDIKASISFRIITFDCGIQTFMRFKNTISSLMFIVCFGQHVLPLHHIVEENQHQYYHGSDYQNKLF